MEGPAAAPDDATSVGRLLGRAPQGDFAVVVRDADGEPVVIRNAPFLDDGTPMPTRYWLVGEPERTLVSRIESAGGVAEAERDVGIDAVTEAHARYAAERDAEVPVDHTGPRPTGGVGGTRRGVKCLHAHYAWHLAGGEDPVGRWVAARLGRADMRQAEAHERCTGGKDRAVGAPRRVAAIDCGTNSTRLLIAEPGDDGAGPGAAAGGLHTVERLQRITRLGQGVDRSGALAPEAVARTVAVLGEFREVMDRHGVAALRMTATSAARDASNREELFAAAEQQVGVRPELLSGEEEGRLSFLGATSDLDPSDGPFLTFDLGGGSTEFGYGTTEPEAGISIDVGCVRLTEKYFEHDPPQPEELVAAISVTEAYLDDVVMAIPDAPSARCFVGMAGTVSTVAAVEIGLAAYDPDRIHHFVLTRDAAEDVFRTLATEPRAARIHNPGLEEARADVIVGGCCALVAIMRKLGIEQLVVSEADILDGLALSQWR